MTAILEELENDSKIGIENGKIFAVWLSFAFAINNLINEFIFIYKFLLDFLLII